MFEQVPRFVAHLWAILCVARIFLTSFSEEKNLTQTGFRNLNFHTYLDHCVVTFITFLLCARPWSGNRDTQMRCLNPVLMEIRRSWRARVEKGRTYGELAARAESMLPEVQFMVLPGLSDSHALYNSVMFFLPSPILPGLSYTFSKLLDKSFHYRGLIKND